MGAQTVMTSQAIGERFGLHTTDLECLDLIALREQASPGELSQATGLTSGAMTALLDRLEKAGYVIRVADPSDRRRQQVRIRAGAVEPIKAVYEPMQSQMFKLWSSFSSHELNLIANLLSRSTDLALAWVDKIHGEKAFKPVKRRPPRTSRKERAGI